MPRYKCLNPVCCFVINEEDLVDGSCPVCGERGYLKKMCELDVPVCSHLDIQPTIKLCPKCGQVVCPQCNSHETHFGISRVTGYLAEVDGWHKGKRAELAQRQRYNASDLIS